MPWGSLDVEAIRRDFPALQERVAGRPVVYLDNACMTLRPRPVLDAILDYYTRASGCAGRSDHLFGQRTTEIWDGARRDLRKFVGARHDREILFTRNATESLNVVARGLDWKAGDVVLTSGLEHNSNLVPWQVLAAAAGVRHEVLAVRPDTTFDLGALASRLADGGVRLVSVLHTSNLTGVAFPVAEICDLAHRHGARVLVDAAQAPLTHALDVRRLAADYLALSAHKMLGPTGFGLLYVRDEHLAGLRPLVHGGETVLDTTYAGRKPAPAPDLFEAGLQDYAGAAGAAAAARYVTALGPDRVRAHVSALNARATERLVRIPRVRVLGPADAEARGSILNFVAEGLPAADLSRLLNQASGVMVRAGKHCVHAWFNATGTPESVRASFGPYNTAGDADALADGVESVLRHCRQGG